MLRLDGYDAGGRALRPFLWDSVPSYSGLTLVYISGRLLNVYFVLLFVIYVACMLFFCYIVPVY